MQYNHKAHLSLIEQAKSEGKEVKTTRISIDEIQRKPCTKTGDYIITLVSKDNQKYSAFSKIWDMQNIDISLLDEGDELDVTYVLNGDYKNFLRVEVVNPHGQTTLYTCTDINGNTIAAQTYTPPADDNLPF